jgi:hypothetical protein
VSWFKSLTAAMNKGRAAERKRLAIEAAERRRQEALNAGAFECPAKCGYRLIWKVVVTEGHTRCLCGADLSLVIRGGRAA